MKVIRTEWSTAYILSALETLFQTHNRGVADDADRLVKECIKYIGPECKGIFFNGLRYTVKEAYHGKRTFYHCPEPMTEKFEHLKRKQARLQEDYQLCKQTLSIRCKPAVNYLDFRNLAPESIIDCFPKEISSLQRGQDIPIPNDLVQGMELIDYYSALRLVV